MNVNDTTGRSKQPRKSVGVVDFFCGCGGASYGFKAIRREDFDIRLIAGIDNDAYCCATYKQMIGAPALQLDIHRLAGDKAALEKHARNWNLGSYDRSVLIGCAPCQGFAAHRKAIDGEDRRRNLFVAFCGIATSLSPDAVLIENVPDLLSQKHWDYFKEGRDRLAAAGYTVRARVYNFAGFGLPQERFRAVVVAMRDPFRLPEPFLDHASYRTVRDAIGGLPPLKSGQIASDDPMHITSKHRKTTIDILRRVPKDGGNRPVGIGPACLDRAREAFGGYTDVYGRLPWDRPAVTITARCRTPSCGRFTHPDQNRGLSVREAALLQGFPKEFHFEGPFDDKFKQIGNAVPPLVAGVFAERILDSFAGTAPQLVDQWAEDDILAPVGPGFAVMINGIKRRRENVNLELPL
jgi:DNA (cytosine-5)-methyltransferase 1